MDSVTMNNTILRIMTNFGRTDQVRAVYDSIATILHNAQVHQLTFIDETTGQQYQPMPDYVAQIVQSGFSVSLLVMAPDNSIFKIDIGKTPKWGCITLYPLEPYKKKKGIDSPQEELDLTFYIERMLELCHGFVVWEFIAK